MSLSKSTTEAKPTWIRVGDVITLDAETLNQSNSFRIAWDTQYEWPKDGKIENADVVKSRQCLIACEIEALRAHREITEASQFQVLSKSGFKRTGEPLRYGDAIWLRCVHTKRWVGWQQEGQGGTGKDSLSVPVSLSKGTRKRSEARRGEIPKANSSFIVTPAFKYRTHGNKVLIGDPIFLHPDDPTLKHYSLYSDLVGGGWSAIRSSHANDRGNYASTKYRKRTCGKPTAYPVELRLREHGLIDIPFLRPSVVLSSSDESVLNDGDVVILRHLETGSFLTSDRGGECAFFYDTASNPSSLSYWLLEKASSESDSSDQDTDNRPRAGDALQAKGVLLKHIVSGKYLCVQVDSKNGKSHPSLGDDKTAWRFESTEGDVGSNHVRVEYNRISSAIGNLCIGRGSTGSALLSEGMLDEEVFDVERVRLRRQCDFFKVRTKKHMFDQWTESDAKAQVMTEADVWLWVGILQDMGGMCTDHENDRIRDRRGNPNVFNQNLLWDTGVLTSLIKFVKKHIKSVLKRQEEKSGDRKVHVGRLIEDVFHLLKLYAWQNQTAQDTLRQQLPVSDDNAGWKSIFSFFKGDKQTSVFELKEEKVRKPVIKALSQSIRYIYKNNQIQIRDLTEWQIQELFALPKEQQNYTPDFLAAFCHFTGHPVDIGYHKWQNYITRCIFDRNFLKNPTKVHPVELEISSQVQLFESATHYVPRLRILRGSVDISRGSSDLGTGADDEWVKVKDLSDGKNKNLKKWVKNCFWLIRCLCLQNPKAVKAFRLLYPIDALLTVAKTASLQPQNRRAVVDILELLWIPDGSEPKEMKIDQGERIYEYLKSEIEKGKDYLRPTHWDIKQKEYMSEHWKIVFLRSVLRAMWKLVRAMDLGDKGSKIVVENLVQMAIIRPVGKDRENLRNRFAKTERNVYRLECRTFFCEILCEIFQRKRGESSSEFLDAHASKMLSILKYRDVSLQTAMLTLLLEAYDTEAKGFGGEEKSDFGSKVRPYIDAIKMCAHAAPLNEKVWKSIQRYLASIQSRCSDESHGDCKDPAEHRVRWLSHAGLNDSVVRPFLSLLGRGTGACSADSKDKHTAKLGFVKLLLFFATGGNGKWAQKNALSLANEPELHDFVFGVFESAAGATGSATENNAFEVAHVCAQLSMRLCPDNADFCELTSRAQVESVVCCMESEINRLERLEEKRSARQWELAAKRLNDFGQVLIYLILPVSTEPPNRIRQNAIFHMLYSRWSVFKGCVECLSEKQNEINVHKRKIGLKLLEVVAKCAQGQSALVEVRAQRIMKIETCVNLMRESYKSERGLSTRAQVVDFFHEVFVFENTNTIQSDEVLVEFCGVVTEAKGEAKDRANIGLKDLKALAQTLQNARKTSKYEFDDDGLAAFVFDQYIPLFCDIAVRLMRRKGAPGSLNATAEKWIQVYKQSRDAVSEIFLHSFEGEQNGPRFKSDAWAWTKSKLRVWEDCLRSRYKNVEEFLNLGNEINEYFELIDEKRCKGDKKLKSLETLVAYLKPMFSVDGDKRTEYEVPRGFVKLLTPQIEILSQDGTKDTEAKMRDANKLLRGIAKFITSKSQSSFHLRNMMLGLLIQSVRDLQKKLAPRASQVLQKNLAKLDLPRMIVSIIADERTKSSHRGAALELACVLLEGNVPRVRAQFMSVVSGNRRALTALYEILEKFQNKSNLQSSETVPWDMRHSRVDIKVVGHTLKFLQLSCEGHYRKMQRFLLHQKGREKSYNLVHMVIETLLVLIKNEFPDSESGFEETEQCLRALTEFVQGPCEQNQRFLALGPFLEGAMSILHKIWAGLNSDIHDEKRVVRFLKVEEAVFQMLLGLLECNQDKAIYISLICGLLAEHGVRSPTGEANGSSETGETGSVSMDGSGEKQHSAWSACLKLYKKHHCDIKKAGDAPIVLQEGAKPQADISSAESMKEKITALHREAICLIKAFLTKLREHPAVVVPPTGDDDSIHEVTEEYRRKFHRAFCGKDKLDELPHGELTVKVEVLNQKQELETIFFNKPELFRRHEKKWIQDWRTGLLEKCILMKPKERMKKFFSECDYFYRAHEQDYHIDRYIQWLSYYPDWAFERCCGYRVASHALRFVVDWPHWWKLAWVCSFAVNCLLIGYMVLDGENPHIENRSARTAVNALLCTQFVFALLMIVEKLCTVGYLKITAHLHYKDDVPKTSLIPARAWRAHDEPWRAHDEPADVSKNQVRSDSKYKYESMRHSPLTPIYEEKIGPMSPREKPDDAKDGEPGADGVLTCCRCSCFPRDGISKAQALLQVLLHYVLYVAFLVMAIVQNPLYACYTLVDIVIYPKTTRFIVDAVLSRLVQIGATVVLGLIAVYLMATTGFALFTGKYGDYTFGDDDKNQFTCSDLFDCWQKHIDQGFEASPVWSDPIDGVTPTYDLFFFIVINTIIVAIITGLIIDTFSQMRERDEEVREAIEGQCFLCGIKEGDFEMHMSYEFPYWKKRSRKRHHYYSEHNAWHYLYLKYYLKIKKKQAPNEMSGLEDYLHKNFERKTLENFLPVYTAMCFDEDMRAQLKKQAEADD